MPRILRARFVHVGHENARMDDLILRFHDQEFQPTDSTIWLRNGGGKSSILNLMFALILPNRHDFLGGKPAQRERVIDHYIHDTEPGYVIIEWELDDQLMFKQTGLQPQRYLTGVAYEKRAGLRDDPGRLQRLFFAVRVVDDEQRLTLEGLPIYTNTKDQLNTILLFKQEWQALLTRHSTAAEFRETDNQDAWNTILRSIGIDAKLYSYQIQMNQREGEADQLFKFSEMDDFVQFFLKLALNPESSESVLENIEAFRIKLHNLMQIWQPEQALFKQLLEQLEPLRNAHAQRTHYGHTLMQIRSDLEYLVHHNEQQQEIQDVYIEEAQAELEAADQQAGLFEQEFQQQQHKVTQWQYARSQQEVIKQSEAVAGAEQAHTQALRQQHIWHAADTLRRLQPAETDVAELEARLLQEQTTLTPVYAELQQTARHYAAALQAQISQLEQEDRQQLEIQEQARLSQQNLRNQAETALTQHKEALIYLKQFQQRLDNFVGLKNKLIAQQVLLLDEDWETAHQRLVNQRSAIQQRRQELEAQRQEFATLINNYPVLRLEIEQAQERARLDQDAAQTSLAKARIEQQLLEEDPVLLMYLEVTQVDLARLDESAFRQLRRAERSLGDEAFRLWQAIHQRRIDLDAIETTGYLPPDPLVMQVLEKLQQHGIVAWSGWQYIRDILPTVERIKEYIASAPAIAAGIVVRDDLFVQVEPTLRKVTLDLRRPIMLVPQYAVLGASLSDAVVVGPTTTAHFEEASAQGLAGQYADQQRKDEQHLQHTRDQQAQIQKLLMQINLFQSTYPVAWFDQQKKIIADAQAKHQRLADDLQALEARLAIQQAKHADLATQIDTLNAQESTLEDHLRQLTQAQHDYPEKQADLETQIQERRDSARQADLAHQHLKQAIDAQQAAIEQATVVRLKLAGRSQSFRDLRHAVHEVPEEIPAMAGDYEQLGVAYDRLRNDYQHGMSQNQLTERLSTARQALQKVYAEFIQKCDPHNLKREEVERTLENITSTEQINKKLEDASTNISQAHYDLEVHKNKQTELATQLATFTDVLPPEQLALFAQHVLSSDANLAEQLQREEEILRRLEQSIREHQESITTMRNSMQQARQLLAASDREKQDLQRLCASASQLHSRMLPNAMSVITPALSFSPAAASSVAFMITQLNQQFEEIHGDCNTLDRQREDVSNALRATLNHEQWSGLQGQHIRKLRGYKNEDFETGFDQLTQDLNRRLQIIEKDMAEVKPNQTHIVELLLNITKRGITLLKSLNRRSKLPATLPAFGGQSFLRVTIQDDLEPNEQRARIRSVLETIIETGHIPSGVGLVQRGIRSLCDTIRIEILFPNPHAHRRYDDIPKLALRSGGERLTCAIMLYCTLAQLRAHDLGRTTGSSTLMLDNPIGKASYGDFLMLQREMARAMNIQLIYRTALDDFEAIKHVPNIEGLGNGYFDLATNEQVIEHDEQARAEADSESQAHRRLINAHLGLTEQHSLEEDHGSVV